MIEDYIVKTFNANAKIILKEDTTTELVVTGGNQQDIKKWFNKQLLEYLL